MLYFLTYSPIIFHGRFTNTFILKRDTPKIEYVRERSRCLYAYTIYLKNVFAAFTQNEAWLNNF